MAAAWISTGFRLRPENGSPLPSAVRQGRQSRHRRRCWETNMCQRSREKRSFLTLSAILRGDTNRYTRLQSSRKTRIAGVNRPVGSDSLGFAIKSLCERGGRRLWPPPLRLFAFRDAAVWRRFRALVVTGSGGSPRSRPRFRSLRRGGRRRGRSVRCEDGREDS